MVELYGPEYVAHSRLLPPLFSTPLHFSVVTPFPQSINSTTHSLSPASFFFFFSSSFLSSLSLVLLRVLGRFKCLSVRGYVNALLVGSMSNFVRKGAAGRVNADRLYAFNKTLKTDSLRERSYWEVNKDTHPINRWSYRRWRERNEELSMFEDKLSKVPVDQKFKIKKLLTVANISVIGPIVLVVYFTFCFFRYRWWGITPIDGASAIARGIQNLPRPPGN